MVEPHGRPSMRRQCELLAVNRSTLYYEAVPPDAEELVLMRRIDEIHLKYPFYGSRKITRTLRDEGVRVNRKRVQRLMRQMGLESVAPKRNTSKPSPEHPVYPYLLGNLKVSRVNQVWAADIERHEALTNLAVGKGHCVWRVAARQMIQVRLARRKGVREEPAVERSSRRNHQLESGGSGLGSNAHPHDTSSHGKLSGRLMSPAREAMVKNCGVAVAKLQGHSWAPTPAKRFESERGNHPDGPGRAQ
jgi:hypothetical protein